MSVARGLVKYYDPSLMRENGGHIEFRRNLALSFLHRMNFVKRKGSTAKSKDTVADFNERKKAFLYEVVTTVQNSY